jgi:hypothetical protein
MLHGDIKHRLARKGQLAGDHFVEHNPKAVEIGASVDTGTACLFGGDV